MCVRVRWGSAPRWTWWIPRKSSEIVKFVEMKGRRSHVWDGFSRGESPKIFNRPHTFSLFHISFTHDPSEYLKSLINFEKFIYILHAAPLKFLRTLYKYKFSKLNVYCITYAPFNFFFFLTLVASQRKFFWFALTGIMK